MRAISLWQPWATLLAHGAKRIETRSWSTSHRGPLLIHAAKTWPAEIRTLPFTEPFKSALAHHGMAPETLPRGVLLGVATLDSVWPTQFCYFDTDNQQARVCLCGGYKQLVVGLRERQFGDYSLNRFAWLFTDFKPFPQPIPYRGEQGLFNVADSVVAGARGRACRQCGCTDSNCRACQDKTGEPCSWVEPDLCSACADYVAAPMF